MAYASSCRRRTSRPCRRMLRARPSHRPRADESRRRLWGLRGTLLAGSRPSTTPLTDSGQPHAGRQTGHQASARATASRMAWCVRSRISGVTDMHPEYTAAQIGSLARAGAPPLEGQPVVRIAPGVAAARRSAAALDRAGPASSPTVPATSAGSRSGKLMFITVKGAHSIANSLRISPGPCAIAVSHFRPLPYSMP